MNKWLRKLQQDELEQLNKQLKQAAEPVTDGDTHELLLRMHRYNHIDHQIQRAIAFSPTLVDLNFVIEISSRVFLLSSQWCCTTFLRAAGVAAIAL